MANKGRSKYHMGLEGSPAGYGAEKGNFTACGESKTYQHPALCLFITPSFDSYCRHDKPPMLCLLGSSTEEGVGGGMNSLLGRVVGKSNALLDVALEILDGLFQELLLLRGDALQNVDGLLGTVGLCS